MRAAPRLLLTLALPMVAFAGCVSPGGVAAMAGADDLDGAAHAWAGDAILVGLFGSEAHGMNATDGLAAGNPVAQALANASESGDIDGRLTGWGGAYWSDSEGKLTFFVRGDDGVQRIDLPAAAAGMAQFPKGVFDGAKKVRDTWAIDSTDALHAARKADPAIDNALSADKARVEYGLDLKEGTWQVQGETYADGKATTFRVLVDAHDGTATVKEIGAEPIGPIGLPGGGQPAGPLPLPIHETGSTTASADPLNFAGQPPCSSPTAQCHEIPFTVERDVSMQAKLTWGVPANDYDFYVLDSSGSVVIVGASAPGAPTGSEETSGELTPGSYKVQIVPWSAAQDTWTFDATFS